MMNVPFIPFAVIPLTVSTDTCTRSQVPLLHTDTALAQVDGHRKSTRL
jgi:hypothetical protein